MPILRDQPTKLESKHETSNSHSSSRPFDPTDLFNWFADTSQLLLGDEDSETHIKNDERRHLLLEIIRRGLECQFGEKRVAMLSLRMQGQSYRKIGESFGIHHEKARREIQKIKAELNPVINFSICGGETQ